MTTATYQCGHTTNITLTGNKTQQAWRVQQLAKELCPTCVVKAQIEQGMLLNLSAMQGTDKQLAIAIPIRYDLVQQAPAFQSELRVQADKAHAAGKDISDMLARYERAIQIALTEDRAGWWLDHQVKTFKDLVQAIMREEYRNEQK